MKTFVRTHWLNLLKTFSVVSGVVVFILYPLCIFDRRWASLETSGYYNSDHYFYRRTNLTYPQYYEKSNSYSFQAIIAACLMLGAWLLLMAAWIWSLTAFCCMTCRLRYAFINQAAATGVALLSHLAAVIYFGTSQLNRCGEHKAILETVTGCSVQFQYPFYLAIIGAFLLAALLGLIIALAVYPPMGQPVNADNTQKGESPYNWFWVPQSLRRGENGISMQMASIV